MKKEKKTKGTDLERTVLALVEKLANEINPQRRVRLTPASSLQRDLGFDSLGLSELLLRSEKEFGVRLADDLYQRLETPRDLIEAVARAGKTGGATIVRRPQLLPKGAIETVPDDEQTLTGVLDWHVRRHGERTHILLSDGYRETDKITYRALSQAAGRVAEGLQSSGVGVNDTVGIMLPTGREFFEAFLGTLRAGAVPVPIYPPMRPSQLEEHLKRQVGILSNAQAAFLFVPGEGKALAALLGSRVETLRGVSTVADLAGTGRQSMIIKRKEGDLAMLQYTSGSTGDPKGVQLTHANLLANIRAMGRAINATSNDVFVSWLPLYHDLGLIGAWLGSLYHAAPVVVMSPLRFIARPECWLWAIHRNSATLSAAPNFAFELCANKIDEASLEGLDLSSLRLLANGAEPVSAETIRRFTERFEKYGFKPEAMTPVYGLAENSVGLAFTPAGLGPIVDRVDRKTLTKGGIAKPANSGDKNPMNFVSCGLPLPDHEVRIVDNLGHEAAERQQGRLEFRGPSSTSGYFRNPEKTSALFHEGWLDSGDLAYIAKGNIFITGRVKDIIIKGGRNIYPEEIEQAAGDLPGIRKGCVVAFASADPATGSERLVVVAETRITDEARKGELQQAVARRVNDVLGAPADEVIIAAPHAIPKTSSGKIRRSATCQLFETGRLGAPARAVWVQMLRLRLTSATARLRHLFKPAADLGYAAYWWAVLTSIGAVTWLGVLACPGRARSWSLVRLMARATIKAMRIPVEASGQEHFAEGRHIVAVNHSSYFDALVLASVLPGEPVFVAKAELARQVVAGPFLRKLGARFAERADMEESLKEVGAYKSLAAAGEKLVFFPEATFMRTPGLLPFRLGAFAIACAADLPILPIAVNGTRSILRGEQWFPRRGIVTVEVLEPEACEGRDFEAVIRLRDRVRNRILAKCGEPDLAEKLVVFEPRG